MAIWQYTFQILCKESVDTLSPDYIFYRDDEGFDNELFWKIIQLKKDFFYEIGLLLPKTKSWSSNIDLYGNQDSNCFEVLFDNKENVLSVSFRIDFTSNYEPILSQIIEFCILNNLIILDEELNVVSLNYEQARSIIENAPQVKKYNELSKFNRSLN